MTLGSDADTGGMPSRAARDLGLERIGASTRFLAVGALVAGGVLSAAVAKALPGKSTSHTTSVPAPGHHSRRSHDDGGAGPMSDTHLTVAGPLTGDDRSCGGARRGEATGGHDAPEDTTGGAVTGWGA